MGIKPQFNSSDSEVWGYAFSKQLSDGGIHSPLSSSPIPHCNGQQKLPEGMLSAVYHHITAGIPLTVPQCDQHKQVGLVCLQSKSLSSSSPAPCSLPTYSKDNTQTDWLSSFVSTPAAVPNALSMRCIHCSLPRITALEECSHLLFCGHLALLSSTDVTAGGTEAGFAETGLDSRELLLFFMAIGQPKRFGSIGEPMVKKMAWESNTSHS